MEPGEQEQPDPVEDTPTGDVAAAFAPPESTVVPEEAIPLPAELPEGGLLPLIEAVLFASGSPVSVRRLAEGVGLPQADLLSALGALQAAYREGRRGFTLEEVGGGWQFVTAQPYALWVEHFAKVRQKKRLTPAGLETLAIIAYKQPLTRADIDAIRGVNSGPLVRILLDKELVKIVGKAEAPGRPALYGTTKRFLEHFGLNSLADLPKEEGA